MGKTVFLQSVIILMTMSGLQAQQPEYLYVGGTETSAYSIDTSTGALTQIAGSPFSLGGTAIAFHPSGQFAYFAGSNGVTVATINAAGGLQEIPGSPFLASGYFQIAFDPSGHYAYVAAQPQHEPAGIYSFTVDGDLGALTPAGPPVVTSVPGSLEVDPSGKFLFAASSTGILVLSINPKNGALTQVSEEGYNCYSVTIDPAIEVLYADCSSGIEAYSIDANSGTLTLVPGSPFGLSVGGEPILIDRTGRFFYAFLPSEIFGELISPDTGALESPLIGSPFQVEVTTPAIDLTSRFLYGSYKTTSSLIGFSISKSSGTLKTLPGSPLPLPARASFSGFAPILKTSTATLVSLAIKPNNPQFIFTSGVSLQFTALGTYNDGSTRYLTASVTWDSSDSAVATISNTPGSSGLTAVVGSGQSTITASLGGVSATTTLTANPLTLVSIAVSPASPVVVTGTAIQLNAAGTFNNGTKQNITATATWTSSNTAVATVNARGIVKGIASGTAVITATSGSVSGSSNLTVNP
jgi:6-phosphogluconolactonase (cycloisomerase 2 family)